MANGERFWLLLRQLVLKYKKPDRVRVLFDRAAKADESPLKECAPQSKDLTI